MAPQAGSAPFRAISFLRNSLRAKEIAVVLLRNGFAELVGKIRPNGFPFHKILPKRDKLSLWQRIRVTCEELGPTFVKFAQIVSTREDILPTPLLEEFKRLRDHVAPIPWEAVEPVVAGELKGGIEANFASFEKTPFACGSIGQVYKATLKSGETVAVKVRRPGAGKAMKADFEILEWIITQAAENVPELAAYDLPGILEEIRDGVMREIDFTFEAKNSGHFEKINDDPRIFAPRVFPALSSARLLVSEWVEGVPPGDPSVPAELARELSVAGGESVFRQIFSFGFFHADPHPGNILITRDGRLCFLDWGCAGTLSRKMRYFLADVFAAVAELNAEKVLQIVLCATPPRERVDKAKIETEIAIVLRRHANFEKDAGAVGHVIFDMLRVFAQHKLPLPRDYALLAKSVTVMEESGRALNPDFDLTAFAARALKNLYAQRWNPRAVGRGLLWNTERQLASINEMPSALQRILWKIENGEIRLNVDHEGLNETRVTLDRSANRTALAMIISSLLVASALLVCAASLGDGLGFAKNLGVAGFVVAAMLTAWLFFIIVWRRK